MEFRRLGETVMNLSIIGFGAWAIGGKRNATGWWELGPADDALSLAAIHRAIDRGVNWIDTAPGYGLGHSEEIIGKSIRGMHDRPYVFTKCGYVWSDDRVVTNNISTASIGKEVDDSLRRLGLDSIDLYQIHGVSPENDHLIDQAWEALFRLKEQGKVVHIGVSNFNVARLQRIQSIAAVETLQASYSLLDRSIEDETLPYCQRRNIGTIAYSPMQTGLLSGSITRTRMDAMASDDARRFNPNFKEPLLTVNLGRVERLRHLATEWNTDPGHIAVAWTLRSTLVTGAIVGFKSPAQVDEMMADEYFELSDAQLDAIEAIGWTDFVERS